MVSQVLVEMVGFPGMASGRALEGKVYEHVVEASRSLRRCDENALTFMFQSQWDAGNTDTRPSPSSDYPCAIRQNGHLMTFSVKILCPGIYAQIHHMSHTGIGGFVEKTFFRFPDHAAWRQYGYFQWHLHLTVN